MFCWKSMPTNKVHDWSVIPDKNCSFESICLTFKSILYSWLRHVFSSNSKGKTTKHSLSSVARYTTVSFKRHNCHLNLKRTIQKSIQWYEHWALHMMAELLYLHDIWAELRNDFKPFVTKFNHLISSINMLKNWKANQVKSAQILKVQKCNYYCISFEHNVTVSVVFKEVRAFPKFQLVNTAILMECKRSINQHCTVEMFVYTSNV